MQKYCCIYCNRDYIAAYIDPNFFIPLCFGSLFGAEYCHIRA